MNTSARIHRLRVLHVGLTLGRHEPPAYLAAHGLKILGGAAGGFVAARRQKPAEHLEMPAGEAGRS